jgi:elongation of very long chain fatty acids protein 6
MLSYESLLLVPAAWSWKSDAVAFYEAHHNWFLLAAGLFYPVIFGIRYAMKDRAAFDLGGAKSQATLNYIWWWEVALAVFSAIGCYHVLPMALEPMLFGGKSFTDTVCGDGVHDDPRSVWMFFFMVSKVFEFGDTIFVVLRKKPLILLQHYHHLATMLYCWYGTHFVYNLNNTNVFFTGMNLAVHSCMYSWYAATRTGWRSPKPLMMFITLIQLVQMVFGVVIIMISGSSSGSCGRWPEEDPAGYRACLFMYFSYLVLFGKLFYTNYCVKGGKKNKKEQKKNM